MKTEPQVILFDCNAMYSIEFCKYDKNKQGVYLYKPLLCTFGPLKKSNDVLIPDYRLVCQRDEKGRFTKYYSYINKFDRFAKAIEQQYQEVTFEFVLRNACIYIDYVNKLTEYKPK